MSFRQSSCFYHSFFPFLLVVVVVIFLFIFVIIIVIISSPRLFLLLTLAILPNPHSYAGRSSLHGTPLTSPPDWGSAASPAAVRGWKSVPDGANGGPFVRLSWGDSNRQWQFYFPSKASGVIRVPLRGDLQGGSWGVEWPDRGCWSMFALPEDGRRLPRSPSWCVYIHVFIFSGEREAG